MDPLTDLLDGVRAHSSSFCQAIWEPPWAVRIADGAALALATPLRGHAWIVPDGAEPILLHTGDIVIIKGPLPYTVGDDPSTAPRFVLHAGSRLTTVAGVDVTDELRLGPRTRGHSDTGSATVASGTYVVDGDVTRRLLDALPAIVRVPAARTSRPVTALLAQEVGGDGPAQQVVLDRLLDIALVATLRAWFDQPGAAAPGWYRAHGDPIVGRALRLMHDDPASSWTVAVLAARVGCSRATLARRFRLLVGEPPITYLAGWRIARAADLLRTTHLTVDAVARRVGYSNAFALSAAFTRARGVSPANYRAGERHRESAPAAASGSRAKPAAGRLVSAPTEGAPCRHPS